MSAAAPKQFSSLPHDVEYEVSQRINGFLEIYSAGERIIVQYLLLRRWLIQLSYLMETGRRLRYISNREFLIFLVTWQLENSVSGVMDHTDIARGKRERTEGQQ